MAEEFPLGNSPNRISWPEKHEANRPDGAGFSIAKSGNFWPLFTSWKSGEQEKLIIAAVFDQGFAFSSDTKPQLNPTRMNS
jgi:hypothetical protein